MTKAEERALEAYPPTFTSGKRYAKRVQSEKVDTHAPIRSIFIKGYEQAEKDLELTWGDMKQIVEIADKILLENSAFKSKYPTEQSYYEKVLRRFQNQGEIE